MTMTKEKSNGVKINKLDKHYWVVKESVTHVGLFDVCTSGEIFKKVAENLVHVVADGICNSHNGTVDNAVYSNADMPAKNKIKLYEIDYDELLDIAGENIFLINSEEPEAPISVAAVALLKLHPDFDYYPVFMMGQEIINFDELTKRFTHYAPVPDIEL